VNDEPRINNSTIATISPIDHLPNVVFDIIHQECIRQEAFQSSINASCDAITIEKECLRFSLKKLNKPNSNMVPSVPNGIMM
jgi:hypothetical protein